jgi:hypothetical protein
MMTGGLRRLIPTKQQRSSDQLWEGAQMTYRATADTIAGNGTQRGYFVNQHQNGDRDYGTFDGKVTTANGVMSVARGSLPAALACSPV